MVPARTFGPAFEFIYDFYVTPVDAGELHQTLVWCMNY
jgi:hypothetical protein